MIGVVTVYISRLVLYFLQYGSSYGELRAPKPAKQDATSTPPPAETLSQQKSRLLLRSARSFPHDLQHGGGGRKGSLSAKQPQREGSKNSQSSTDDVLSESFHTIGDITNPDIVDHVQANPR